MPFRLFKFTDGYYIVDAIDDDLVGHEVLALGETPIDSVAAALAPYVSTDNRSHRRRKMGMLLLFANPLKAVGAVEQTGEFTARMRTPDGNRITRTVQPGGIMNPFTLFYAKSLYDPISNEWSPAYINPREKHYRFSYRDSTDLLYVQFNNVRNISEDWTIADFADSLRHIADTRPLDKVVVDLRINRGGHTGLLEPLVELFANHPKIDQRGTLYTLIGRYTFSAAGTMALEMERRTKTIFVGEEGGFATSSWGDVPYLLPNSLITVNVYEHFRQKSLPEDPRTYLEPDIFVPLTSRQHFADVDSTMMVVRQHEPEPTPRNPVSLTNEERESYVGTYRLSPIHRARIVDSSGTLHLRVERGRLNLHPFLETALYPRSSSRLATDITDTYLERRPGSNELTLSWKDTTYALTPVDSTFTLHSEYIRADQFEQAAQRLRSIESSGFLLDKWVRRTLTSKADTLEELDRPEEALRWAKLAVELFPHSRDAYSRLGYTYEVLDMNEEAIRTYRKLRAVDPTRTDAVERKLRKLKPALSNPEE